MKTVANNDRYELKVDESINRMYITIKGYWRIKDNYLEDLEEACKLMKPKFKIHVDLTTMTAPPAKVGVVHEEAQKMLMKYGLAQTAEVHNDSALTRLAVNRYSENSGMTKQVFSSHEEAKKWLDQ
ncbi:hypothetical protein [Reichenbachiella ulvae]|uniref:SpoIIAA-like n=1 Tax=Reichenbachiella ulvae TaxID=2980104 RepID=A0ABT3CS77_9BACT|nr:hypothetical protein [Reichenbachiella ulvae]MCV9386538.1 hypothetical protein [Reichenbachiella ulvae]